MATWYPVGNRMIAMTEEEADNLRVLLQTEFIRKRINDIIEKNSDCFHFTSDASRPLFVARLADMHYDLIDIVDCYEENLEEAVFQFARDMGVGKGI